jgi:hypothetical protein
MQISAHHEKDSLSHVPSVGAKTPKGEIIDYGEAYWVATPIFETGDPHYSLLNNIITVAEARVGPGASWIE